MIGKEEGNKARHKVGETKLHYKGLYLSSDRKTGHSAPS